MRFISFIKHRPGFDEYEIGCTLRFNDKNYAFVYSSNNSENQMIKRIRWTPLTGPLLTDISEEEFDGLLPAVEYLDELENGFNGKHYIVNKNPNRPALPTGKEYFGIRKSAKIIFTIILALISAVTAFICIGNLSKMRMDFSNVFNINYRALQFARHMCVRLPEVSALIVTLFFIKSNRIKTVIGAILNGITQTAIIILLFACATYRLAGIVAAAAVVVCIIFSLIYRLRTAKPKLNPKKFIEIMVALTSLFTVVYGLFFGSAYRFSYIPASKEKIVQNYEFSLKDLNDWDSLSQKQKAKDIQAIIDKELIVDAELDYSMGLECSDSYNYNRYFFRRYYNTITVSNFVFDKKPAEFLPLLLHCIRSVEFSAGLVDIPISSNTFSDDFDDSSCYTCGNAAEHSEANLFAFNKIKDEYASYLTDYEASEPESSYCLRKKDGDWVYNVHYSLTQKFKPYISIKEYTNDDESIPASSEVSIPEKFDGITVKEIEATAFPESLQKISIPGTVNVISPEAFENCKDLTEIVFAKNSCFTFVNGLLIDNNSGTVILTLKNTVGKITIPANVKKINDTCFTDCRYVSEIEADKNNKYYKTVDGLLYSSDGKLIRCPEAKQAENITLPDTCKAIGDYAFENCIFLKSLTLSKSIKDIGKNAFKGSIITDITIPKTVRRIHFLAFDGAEKLKTIHLNSADIFYYSDEQSEFDFSLENTGVESIYFSGTPNEFGYIRIYLKDESRKINIVCPSKSFEYSEQSYSDTAIKLG